MADLSQISTEELMRMRGAVDLSSMSTEDLMKMRGETSATEQESPTSAWNLAGAAVEPNLTMASGAIATPIAGLAGIAGTLLPGEEGQGADWTRAVQQALTYRPKTIGGQNAMDVIGYPFEKLAEGADYLGRNVSDITGSPAAGAAVNTATQLLPALLGKKLTGADKVLNKTADVVNVIPKALSKAKEHLYPTPGQIGVKAAGEKTKAVIEALKRTESEVPGAKLTAGQAAAVANSAEFSALQKLIESKNPSRSYEVDLANKVAEKAHLARLAKGDTQEASMLARKADKKTLGEVEGSRMQSELETANIAGKLLPRLENKAARYGELAKDSVEDVRRLSKAGETAESLAQSGRMRLGTEAPPIPGLPRAPAQYSYGRELAELADKLAKTQADNSLLLGENARFAKMQADSLAKHGLKPIDGSQLVRKLADQLDNDPEIYANKLNRTAITSVAKEVARAMEKGKGIPDAKALHEIRKSAINNTVQKFLAGSDPKSVNARAATLLNRVKPIIDEAIGPDWKKAVDDFAEGAHRIDRTKMGTKALELYDKSPDELIRLAEGNAPKVVEKVFGPGNISLAKQMGGTEAPIKAVVGDLMRRKKMDELAVAGSENLKSLIGSETVPPTGLFMPMLSAARSWINTLLRSGDEIALRKLEPIMNTDPKKMAALMEAATPKQRAKISSLLSGAATRATVTGSTVGSAAQQENR